MTEPLRSFRESRWRYLQFVVVGLLVAGLVGWLSPLGRPALRTAAASRS
jgi:hypothetical protein